MRANTDVKTFIFYDERECGSCFHVLLRPLELQGGEQETAAAEEEEEDRASSSQSKKAKEKYQAWNE